MRRKIFSKMAMRHVAIALVLAISLVPISTSPVAAQVGGYFEISYDFELSKTEIQGSEVFYATVTGEATCIETLPSVVRPVSEAKITFRIVAEPQAGGDSVILNPSYTVTIKPFPDEEGETTEINRDIPLQFPVGSESGDYDVVAELVEAKVHASFGWFDVTDYLPPSQALGPVTYTALANNPPNAPSPPSGLGSGYTGTSYSYSTSATDPDGDQVKYTFDWRDGTTSQTGFVDSGTTANESHTWSSPGTYYVKAKATDSKDASSGWSSSKKVTISGHPPDADFEAFPREGKAPLEVRFENWWAGGTEPYVKAEWDFDCDGELEITLTGTHAEVMADVTWTYPFPGTYTVCLTMTDSTEPEPYVSILTKLGYINVLFNAWAYDENEDSIIQKMEAIHAVMDYFDGKITKAQAIEVVMLYFG